MKVVKKAAKDVKLEPAHDGAGSRKLFVKEDEVANIQGITHGWLRQGGRSSGISTTTATNLCMCSKEAVS